jgi:hypothetical protein
VQKSGGLDGREDALLELRERAKTDPVLRKKLEEKGLL